MPTLYSYSKVRDEWTTYELLTHGSIEADKGPLVAELGVIDGLTYVMVPDGLTLPRQPEQVVKTLKQETMAGWMVEGLKAVSPTLKLTARRMAGSRLPPRYNKRDVEQLSMLAIFFEPAVLADHIDRYKIRDVESPKAASAGA